MSCQDNPYRDMIVKLLAGFYESNGIVPGKEFNCLKFDKCFPQGKSGEFCHGMQCHVGHKYGQGLRVVVVSLDCGAGGADVIEKRTANVENPDNHKNPHMKGTIKLLEDIYDIHDQAEVVQYFAMLNSAKCCRSESTNQMRWLFHHNCSTYKLDEIELLDPQIVVFQGKHSLAGCGFENISSIPSEWQNILKWVVINGSRYVAIITRHPSSYRYMRKDLREQYVNTLANIASYVRTHIKELIEPTAKDVLIDAAATGTSNRAVAILESSKKFNKPFELP